MELFKPIPLPLDALPERLRKIIKGMEKACNIPVEIPFAYSLGILGGAVGTSVGLEIKPGWIEYPFLWILVGAPVGVGKTTAINGLMQPIYERQRDQNVPLFLDDFTLEAMGLALNQNPRGLIICQDEFSALIASFNQYKGGQGSDFERLEKLWTCQPIKIDRKKQPPIFTPPTSVSIVGGIPIQVLATFLRKQWFHTSEMKSNAPLKPVENKANFSGLYLKCAHK